ncbi:hypothetical protein [Clostridium porci]|uniref:Uncharacterized protein n=1 Tax=Clostridium porci TaxID=2605778 RepID=A0A7X2NKH4_9CLOT|nr:hypothetical protein [Clostridium porci]MSS36492.1 hypothetical protein [Clostridium porci]
MEDAVKRISSEKFDAMLERIMDNGHPISGWFPTMEDAKIIIANPIENYEFMIWILESNPNLTLTEEQEAVYALLQNTLTQCTQITDH